VNLTATGLPCLVAGLNVQCSEMYSAAFLADNWSLEPLTKPRTCQGTRSGQQWERLIDRLVEIV